MQLQQWHSYIHTKSYKREYCVYTWEIWKIYKVRLKVVCSLTYVINSDYNFV